MQLGGVEIEPRMGVLGLMTFEKEYGADVPTFYKELSGGVTVTQMACLVHAACSYKPRIRAMSMEEFLADITEEELNEAFQECSPLLFASFERTVSNQEKEEEEVKN